MSAEQKNVVYLNQPKRFRLDEARALMPQVKEITSRSVKEAEPIIRALQENGGDDEDGKRLTAELQQCVDQWASEIAHLGAMSKGLWLVDFDSGSGYYCWRYDEDQLEYFHPYDGGFSGRTPIL